MIAHINCEGRPPQPHTLQQLPITLTLRSTTTQTEINYPTQQTDQYGFFTVTVPFDTLPPGIYSWRADDVASAQPPHPPNYLANSGTLTLSGEPITSVDMGTMRTGDASNDNAVTTLDFNILKTTFGKAQGDLDYDPRADFNGNNSITTLDFTLLKTNFGHGGAPPIQATLDPSPKFAAKSPKIGCPTLIPSHP
jgi:hypothetical protein